MMASIYCEKFYGGYSLFSLFSCELLLQKHVTLFFYLKYFLIIYLIVHSFTHIYAIVNKTVNIYLIRIYQVGIILLCEKHNIFRICMSTFSKTRKFSTIREGNIWLDLWKYKRHLYVVIRRGSFSGKGSRKKYIISEMEMYSLC